MKLSESQDGFGLKEQKVSVRMPKNGEGLAWVSLLQSASIRFSFTWTVRICGVLVCDRFPGQDKHDCAALELLRKELFGT
jgi:hypothetical protein